MSREIVDYAAERFITVVPEIEMPGHSQAALAAYPELSCTGGPFEVQTQWGIHDDVYCAGREETFAFLEDVLTQVMELFPGRYIHIGGDEVPKDRWRECRALPGTHRGRRVWPTRTNCRAGSSPGSGSFSPPTGAGSSAGTRSSDGRSAGRSGQLVVQAWRGMDAAAAAARAGHDVIVSPTSHAYFDYDPGVLDLRQGFRISTRSPRDWRTPRPRTSWAGR